MVFIFIILSLLMVKPYFHQGVPYTHDGENHLVRFAQYKQALREGQFPPRWAPNLLNHFGYPVFNYNYPLANILSLPFSILKIHYQLTFKLLVWSFVLLGLVGANLWLKKLKFKLRPRIFSLLVWSLNPYLINLIFFRGNIGEIMSLNLLPWLFYGVEVIKNKKLTKKEWLLLIIFQTGFLLAHNVAVLFGVPLVLIYATIRFRREINSYFNLGIGWLVSILLSLWFWLPAMLEKKLIILDQANLSVGFADHFPVLQQLLFSPLQFGLSYAGQIDSLSFAIGLSTVLILIISGILILSNPKRTNLIWWGLWILSAGSVLFQLKWSYLVWEIIPLANFIQFPWRLTLFLSVLVLPLTAWVWKNLKNKAWLKRLLLVIVVIQFLGVWRLAPLSYVNKNKIEYELHPGTTSTSNENLPKDFTFEYFQAGDWQPQPQILVGNEIENLKVEKWTGSAHYYSLKLNQKSLLVEPTANFAGWQTKIKNQQNTSNQSWQKVKYYDDQTIRGRIAYWLEPGEYVVQTNFTQSTFPRITGNTISVLTIMVLAGWFIFYDKKTK